MAPLLSEASSFALYDKGHKSFRSSMSPYDVELPQVNLNQLLAGKNPSKSIKNLEPQVLYFSLKNQGLNDSIEVLKYISSEQLIKIFDYDVWHESSLSPTKAFTWLKAFSEIDPEYMLKRYKELDEEYQVALLSKYVIAYDNDAFESMNEAEQDALYHIPGNQIYYSVSGLDQKTHEAVVLLIETAAERDIEYALALLGHTSFLPPNETEDCLVQFRTARLEEDGFVSYDEGRSFFVPMKTKEYEKSLGVEIAPSQQESQSLTTKNLKSFFEQVMELSDKKFPQQKEQRQKSLLFLLNGLISATQVEQDNLSEIKQLLRIARSCLSFSLEALSQGQVEVATELLNKKCHIKDLFRYFVSVIDENRKDFLQKLEKQTNFKSKSFLDDLNSLKFGVLLDRFDKKIRPIIGFEGTEVLKAFFNRFPMVLEPKTLDERTENNQHHLFFKPIASRKDLHTVQMQLKLCLQQTELSENSK